MADASTLLRALQRVERVLSEAEAEDDDPSGSGLRGLADGVEALAGRLAVTSTAGAGTTLRAEMPCA